MIEMNFIILELARLFLKTQEGKFIKSKKIKMYNYYMIVICIKLKYFTMIMYLLRKNFFQLNLAEEYLRLNNY